MKTFYIQCGTEKILLIDRERVNAPPLSFYFRVATQAAEEFYATTAPNIPAILKKHFLEIVRRGRPRNQFSDIQVLAAAFSMFIGRWEDAKRQLRCAYDADPSSIYALSLVADLFPPDDRFGHWAERRIAEAALWRGHEDFTVIGDSHVYAFGGVARCDIRYVGSLTMHRIGRDGFDFATDTLPPGQNVVLAFGEIDARCHTVKQRERTGIDFETIVRDVVERYFVVLEQAFAGRDDLTPIVMGIVPPIRACDLPSGWVYGPDADRLAIHRFKNAYLEEKCRRHGLKFLDVYSGFHDEDGFIDKAVWDGDHHLSPRNYRILEYRLAVLTDSGATVPRFR